MSFKNIMAAIKEYKFIAQIMGNGKITIPVEVRQVMELKDKMMVEVIVKAIPKNEGSGA